MSSFSFAKRILTPDEIEYILSDIKKLRLSPCQTIHDSVMNPQLKYMRNELGKIEVYADVPFKNVIEALKEDITQQFVTTLAEPGDMVGVLAAQSIGQPITQCTLSGFHKTGSENVTTTKGIAKFGEILNATTNPKNTNCKIYLKTSKDKNINDVRLWTNRNLKEITIDKLIKKYEICVSKHVDKSFYARFEKYYRSQQYQLVGISSVCIRLYLNVGVLWTHRVYMREIAQLIENKFTDSCCVWSPEYDGIIDVYVDLSDIDCEEYEDFFEKIVYKSICRLRLTNCVGISDAFVRVDGDQYVIDTNGSNIQYVFSLDEVDEEKSTTNNMKEIYLTFGIEATYEFLIKSIEEILAEEGTGVSRRHLTILASVMTHMASISSINRYGMQSQLSGCLTTGSFEQTLDNFLKAAYVGSKDHVDEVSASIICGSIAKIGTNMCDILMDLN